MTAYIAPGNSGQKVGVSEVTITERQVRVAAPVRHGLNIARVDEGSLEGDPDQGTKETSSEPLAAGSFGEDCEEQ